MDFVQIIALAAQTAGQQQPQAPQIGSLLFPIVIIVFLFYFIIMRPQKREQQRQQQLRDSVKKGDKVVSIGGIHGTVVSVDKEKSIVTVQVDKTCKIDFSKAAISTVITKDEPQTAQSS